MQPLKSQTLRTIHESSPKRHLKYQCPIIKSSSILSNTKLPKSPIQLTRQIYETAGNLRRLNRVNRISRDDFRVFVAPPYRVGGASRLRRSHLSRLGKKNQQFVEPDGVSRNDSFIFFLVRRKRISAEKERKGEASSLERYTRACHVHRWIPVGQRLGQLIAEQTSAAFTDDVDMFVSTLQVGTSSDSRFVLL